MLTALAGRALRRARRLGAFVLGAILATAVLAVADEIGTKSSAQRRFEDGLAELKQNHLDQAETSFKRALEIDPKFVLPYLGLSDVHQQKGDVTGASAFLQKALSLAPQNAGVRTAWGKFLFSRKRYPEAEQAYKKAIALDPNAPVPQGLLGDLYLLALKKPADAASAYQASLALNAAEPHANFMLGLAWLALGKTDEGEAQLIKAKDLDPQNLAIRKDLADVQLHQGKLDLAAENYRKALELDQRAAWAQIGLGDVSMRRKNYQDAIGAYQGALALSSDSVEARTKLAMSEELKGDFPSAEAGYRKAIELEPRNSVAANNLAWLLAIKENKPKEGLPWAEKAASGSGKNANFQDTLAWVLRANQENARALLVEKRAAAIEPKNPQILYHLGVLYEEAGNSPLAATQYAQALAIAKTFDGAADAEARLAALKKN